MKKNPKESDFKNKSKYFITRAISGSENAELRNSIRKLCNASWDFSNKVTHSDTKDIYDASIAYSLCVATTTVLEKLMDKVHDPFAKIRCIQCGSKNIKLFEKDEELYGECYICGTQFKFIEE